MAFTSRLLLRATSALRMSAARWSGRTSASAPFTLPMGVRQASTTNTELTLTHLSMKPSATHDKTCLAARWNVVGRRSLPDRDHQLARTTQPVGGRERRDRYR